MDRCSSLHEKKILIKVDNPFNKSYKLYDIEHKKRLLLVKWANDFFIVINAC